MKRYKITFTLFQFLLWSLEGLLAQSADQNYIMTKTYTKNDNATAITQIQYFDGLGRPIETVQRGITPAQKDLVTLTEYDGVGREQYQYLPKANAGNGAYVAPAAFKNISQTEYGGDSRPFNEIKYEPSPLNRVTEQFGAGSAWQAANKRVVTEYGTNTNEVKYFYADNSNQLVNSGYYAANTLYKTISIDEDGKQTAEYKDKLGRVVMQRNGADVDTYYAYNDLGQLCYVLPALAADASTNIDFADAVNKYGYKYQYDDRGNCILKKLPGCTPIYMIYDKADRLVLSQDGNQRKRLSGTNIQWTVTKYDIFGRVVFTGITYLSATDSLNLYQTVRDTYKDDLVIESYTGGIYSNNKFSNASPLTVNYYDDYNFITDTELEYVDKTADGYSVRYTPPSGGRGAAGLLTGARTYLLDDSGNYTVSAMYYDDKGRVVQSRSTNHLGGYDIVYNDLDFTGKPNKTLKQHSAETGQLIPMIPDESTEFVPAVSELYTYTYDGAGRVTKSEYKLNNNPAITLSDMTAEGSYDELGRLKTKKRHNATDTESFEYNIRNWTTKITSGTFEENLYYNTNPDNNYLCFNGNISYSTIKNGNTYTGYKYNYDELNRLKNAFFKEGNISENGYYDESFRYDKIGNIIQICRTVSGCDIDALGFTYNGNQITKIIDDEGSRNQYDIKEYQDKAGDTNNEMSYDTNGNLVKDLDREITEIQYNILNLPKKVTFANGNAIENQYDAGGRKLSSRYLTKVPELSLPVAKTTSLVPRPINTLLYTGTETNYIGNIEYETEIEIYSAIMMEPTYNLAHIYNPEGYVTAATNPLYYYFRKDHLGNNREVWCANTGGIIQRTQYYPSGLPREDSQGQDEQNKKYNGKEFVEAHGYDTYDYGARGYYSAIGRFTSVDPLAEKKPWLTPYHYCSNNPINRFDPDGMDDYRLDRDGNLIFVKQTKADNHTIYATNSKGEIDKKTSIDVSKSVVSGKETISDVKGKTSSGVETTANVDVYTLFGGEQSKDLFEFATKNTDVEWSQVKTTQNGEEVDYITTSHEEEMELGQSYVIRNFFSENDKMANQNSILGLPPSIVITEANHNHPNTRGIWPYPSAGDVSVAKLLQERFPNAKMNIYTSGNGQYNSFDRYSIPGLLRTFEIVAPRKTK